VPHGALWYLPFAALRNDECCHFLAHLLTLAASEGWPSPPRSWTSDHHCLRAWVGEPRMPKANRCGESALRLLPGAGKEAERIAEILGARPDRPLRRRTPAKLHFEAWHSAFSVSTSRPMEWSAKGDPLESFLVLRSAPEGPALRLLDLGPLDR
jgi:hypothetical protein